MEVLDILKVNNKKKTINKGGYVYYDLYKNQKRKRYFAHQLVYLTFIGDYDRKLDINHIDCNKQNNEISNLELTTRSENMKHAVRNGLCKKTIEQSFLHLDKQKRMVLNLETGIFYESIKEASFYHDLNRSTLTQRLDGKLKNNTYFIKL